VASAKNRDAGGTSRLRPGGDHADVNRRSTISWQPLSARHHADTMPVEQLTYAQIAERLGISSEAARAIVKRHRLPRSRANDGKSLVAIELEEVRHKPLPARSPRGHQPVTDLVATLKAKVELLEAELAAEQQRSAGHRADYERERDRADRVTELEGLRRLLAAAQEAAWPVTPGSGAR
jgi:hypothetical protein